MCDDGMTGPTVVVQDGVRPRLGGRGGMCRQCTTAGQWRRWQRVGELADPRAGQPVEAPDGKLWTLPEDGGPPSVVDLATGQAEGVAG